MKRAFKHALHERSTTDAVLIEIRSSDQRSGWGEVLPRPYVTGETVDAVLNEHAPQMARALIGVDFGSMADVVAWLEAAAEKAERRLATLCGLDLALLDLAGQAFEQSLTSVLGSEGRNLPAGVIVGFETSTETLARYCAALRLSGRRHIKVKVGQPDDIERLRIISKVFKGIPLRLDANAAWSTDEAIKRLEQFKAEVPIASIEQPIAPGDNRGLRLIRESTGVPMMADESVCTLDDGAALIDAQAADIFNIRLGKNGGLLASKRLVDLATSAGVTIHLGTMVGETGVLSRAGELFGHSIAGFECLDGKGQNAFLLEVDIVDESSQHDFAPDATTGLGVRIHAERLAAHQVGTTVTIS